MNIRETDMRSGGSVELQDLQFKLQAVIESSPNSILIVDTNLLYVDVLTARDQLHQYIQDFGAEKLLEECSSYVENEKQFEIYRDVIKRVIDKQMPVDFSYQIKFQGKWFYYYAHAISYQEDKAMVSTRNINLLKEQENEIKTLQELVNTIIDHLPLGVLVKDAEDDFNYLYWNRYMEEITGVDTTDIEGKNDKMMELGNLMSAEKRIELDEQVMQSGEKLGVKLKVKANSGEIRDMEVIKYPISLSDGKPLLLALWRDITAQLAAEKILSEAKSKAETADMLKSKYLANMSHEIRTPLSAIAGFSELLAYADSDEERRSYYEIIKTNNELLLQLVNDILDISKIEADVIKIAYSEVNLDELLRNIYTSAQLRMPENVKLILEEKTDICVFNTDPVRLMQLINNLLNNAIKNTHEGCIVFGYKKTLEQIHFYVKDTGIGIQKDRLAGIFDRFVKINDYIEGIGLGLAICQGLIAKMGGRIFVESEVGVGSTFSFTLPVHPVEII